MFLLGCGAWVSGQDTSPPDSELLVGPAVDPTGYQVLDARSPEAYASGHLPGALSTPWEKLTIYSEDGLWDEAERDAAADWLAASGLDAGGPYLVYGDALDDYGGDGFVYWVLRHLGHEAQVLDGGFPAWIGAGGVAEAGETDRVPGTFVALEAPDPPVLVTTDEVAASSDQRLDVRSPDEFAAGHLPGAVTLEYVEALAPDGRFHDTETLRGLLEDAGLAEGRTITYCRSGIRAGHGFLLLELVGWPARDYLGSWVAWEESGGPVE